MKAHEKFSRLSPEEREALKQRMWEKWCRPHSDVGSEKPKAEDSSE
jgi:hypothetical protein